MIYILSNIYTYVSYKLSLRVIQGLVIYSVLVSLVRYGMLWFVYSILVSLVSYG